MKTNPDLWVRLAALDFDGDDVQLDNGVSVAINNDVPENNDTTLDTRVVFEDGLNNFDPTHNVDGDDIEGSTGIGGGASISIRRT